MRIVAGLSYQSDISERIVFRFHTGMINGFANSFSQSSEETDIRTYPLWIGGPDTSETNTLTEVIKYSGGIAWGLYTNAGLA
ncbi:MAG: hypothetical protein Fur0041_09510 [Bacteroidia bacterium]